MPGIAGGSKLSATAAGIASSLGRTWATICEAVRPPRSLQGLSTAKVANQSNALATFAVLKPWSERGGLTASQIVAQVRPKLLAIPAAAALSLQWESGGEGKSG